MGKASKIGSAVYNALPEYWRRGWMYRSFTGEAYKMLKAGKNESEIQQVLLQRYVEPVINKHQNSAAIASLRVKTKRAYHKQDTAYWRKKIVKASRGKARKVKLLYNAGILARASKVGSYLYRFLPQRLKTRSRYQQLTRWAIQLLKNEYDEAVIIAALLPTLAVDEPPKCLEPAVTEIAGGSVSYAAGKYFFITSLNKRFELTATCTDFVKICTLIA